MADGGGDASPDNSDVQDDDTVQMVGKQRNGKMVK